MESHKTLPFVGAIDEVMFLGPLERRRGQGVFDRTLKKGLSPPRAALGRLAPAAGVTLADLLEVEMPRIPRNLVAIVVTRVIDDALMLALDGLRRSGVELSVMWIGPPDLAGMNLPPLPRSVTLHAIFNEDQLENLGAQAL